MLANSGRLEFWRWFGFHRPMTGSNSSRKAVLERCSIMKGVVFTEFLGFVEETFGIETVDHLLTRCSLPSGGIYTAVATYDVAELVDMLTELSRRTDRKVPDLVREYGHHLFRFFARTQQATMGNVESTEQLMASVDNRIHVDVRKLYPDAELPSIQFEKLSETQSRVIYESQRPFADLAEGLILEAVVHFGDPISVVRRDLGDCDGTNAEFILTRSE
jgi:hypothetical protein